MAEQLASVLEESTIDDFTFAAPSPACYSYRESIWPVAGPERRIRSTLSSQSGEGRSSSYSSISGASYPFNISGWASAGAADFGADELHQRRPSIHKHKVSSSLAKQLSSMSDSEESTTVCTASCPPSHSYRESIRGVVWPEWRIISTLSSQSGQSGSSYSGASSSYMSKNSGFSSGTACATELMKIAHRMVSDGYIQRMVQSFIYGGELSRVLETWFVELDVDWVLQGRRVGQTLRQQLEDEYQQHNSAWWLQELVTRWIRALTIIVVSIKELAATVHETLAVARFGRASISAMLVFVDTIVDDYYEVKKLHAMLPMYICVSTASYDMSTMHLISPEAQSIFKEMGASLDREENRLIGAMSKMVRGRWAPDEVDTISNKDPWDIEILRGGGKVDSKIRLLVDYIVSIRKALASTQNSAQSHNTGELCGLTHWILDYLKDLLLRKSKSCLDPSLRYLFLLNNSYFIESLNFEVESGGHHLGPECEKYMDSYLDVSWGYVMSCLPQTKSTWPSYYSWPETSAFQSAFYTTYRSHKLWKVPDPRLRSLLRITIINKVISGYRDCLKERPEIEKKYSHKITSPDDMEKMLGELFEG